MKKSKNQERITLKRKKSYSLVYWSNFQNGNITIKRKCELTINRIEIFYLGEMED